MSDEEGETAPRWPLVAFRACITLAALLTFNQAVFAGQFLAGTYGSLHTHRENATAAGLTVVASGVSAVLVHRPGRGPWWPAVACLGLFGLIGLQIVLGFGRVLALHVPLGVTIILLTVLLAIWAWRPRAPAPALGSPEQ
jgi:hypothetical protein